jgi:hypothetical protein
MFSDPDYMYRLTLEIPETLNMMDCRRIKVNSKTMPTIMDDLRHFMWLTADQHVDRGRESGRRALEGGRKGRKAVGEEVLRKVLDSQLQNPEETRILMEKGSRAGEEDHEKRKEFRTREDMNEANSFRVQNINEGWQADLGLTVLGGAGRFVNHPVLMEMMRQGMTLEYDMDAKGREILRVGGCEGETLEL